jgi:hypothetical protein
MRLPKGITLRIKLLGWVVTLVTLGIFAGVVIPEQKREFQLSLESKARGVAVSIRGVAAGAAVSEDYSAVVDQAMQVLSDDAGINRRHFRRFCSQRETAIGQDAVHTLHEILNSAWLELASRAAIDLRQPLLRRC